MRRPRRSMSLIIAADLGANAAIEDPNGTWAQIAAFLPPLSPMVVPTRVVLGDMGAVGLVAAVAVELLAIFLLIRVAAGIYVRASFASARSSACGPRSPPAAVKPSTPVSTCPPPCCRPPRAYAAGMRSAPMRFRRAHIRAFPAPKPV
jgi:hypothetical protein